MPTSTSATVFKEIAAANQSWGKGMVCLELNLLKNHPTFYRHRWKKADDFYIIYG